VHNLFLLVNLDRVNVTHWWVFSCIFVIFSLQITKGLRFNSYPVSLLTFSFLPLAVYPVGVKTYWCYFLWIIVYNVVTVYGIATKYNITMHTYTVLLCTKFQDNQATRLRFMTTFVVWQEEKQTTKKKTKKNSANFRRFIRSRKHLAWFSWNYCSSC